jgi:hypothetical protein
MNSNAYCSTQHSEVGLEFRKLETLSLIRLPENKETKKQK